MKTSNQFLPRPLLTAITLVATLLGLGVLEAGQTWTGGGGANTNWSNTANWGGAAPAYGTIVFNGTAGTTNSLDNNFTSGGSAAMNQVQWSNNVATGWTMTNGNSTVLSLFDNSGTQAKLENYGLTSPVFIKAPITFAANNASPLNPFGEISAINSDIYFNTPNATLTVNGSSVNGIKLWGGNHTVAFSNTVSASGRWFATTATGAILSVGPGASITSSNINIMNNGVMNYSGGSFVMDANAGLRLGGDFGVSGNQNQTQGGTLNLTASNVTFTPLINSVTANTSGTLTVGSQNVAGTNYLTGGLYTDSALKMTNAAGGYLIMTGAGDIKTNTLTFSPAGNMIIAALTSSLGAGGNIVLTNTGTLLLTNLANSYSGTVSNTLNANSTQIGGGTLGIYGDGSLGTIPAGHYNNIQFTGSGTLQDTLNNITLNSNRDISIASGVTATLDSSINTFTVNGIINGSGSLASIGTGTLKLSGVNTFSGGSTFSAGIVNVGTNAGGFGTGPVTINAPAIFYNLAGGALNITNSLTLNGGQLHTGGGSGSLNWSGPVTLGTNGCSLAGDGSTAAITISGGITVNSNGSSITAVSGGSFGGSITTKGIAGTGGILNLTNNLGGGLAISTPITGALGIAAGGGTVTLSGNNTYSGTTTVNAGTLSITAGYLSTATTINVVSGATLTSTANNTFSQGGTSQGGAWTIAGTINGSSAGDQIMPASVTLNNGTMGGATFASFGTFLCFGAATTITANGTNIITAGNIGNNNVLTFSTPLATDALTNSGYIGASSVNNGSVVKSGLGTLTLSGANTYTGNTTLNANGGTLAITAGGLYTSAYIATPVVTVNSGATLSLAAWQYSSSGGALGQLDLGAARLSIKGGTITYNGVGEGSGAANNGRLFTIGTGGATLNAAGSGTWFLENSPSYGPQPIPTGLTLTLTGSSNGQYDNSLTNTAGGSLVKSGSGTWTLNGANTYAGSTTLNASSGTLKIGGAGTLGGGNYAGGISIGSGSTLQFSSSATQTLSGVTGFGALTKDFSSASTLTLSGTVSYSGATRVSAGTLIVPSAHTGTGVASVSNNATLGVTASGTSQWQPASLALSNSCTLTFSSVQNSGTTTAPLLPTAAVGTVSSVTVKVSSISGTATVGNSYPLLGNEGGTTNGYTLGTQPVGVVGHLATSGTTLVYVVDSVSDIWAGTDATQPSFWNIATTTNWTGYAANNSPAYTFAQNDYVLFDDTATPASPVSVALQAAVTPAAVIFNNGTKSYTVTSTLGNMIGGSGSLTLNGSGKVIFAGGTNGYTGGTVINAGTLEADVAGVLSTGLVTLNGGALSNNVSATLANPINLSGASTVGVGSSQTLTLSSAVTNTGALTKQGAGTLTLSGNNNFSGAVTVNAGTLNFSGGTNTYGSSSINVNNQLAQNSTLQFSGGSFTAGGSSGTRSLNLISGATASVSGSASVTLAGIVSLGTSLTGSSGNFTLSGGTLSVNGFDSANLNRAFIIGEYSSETSTFTMSGGTLNVPSGRTYLGWTGTGIWNIYGGIANVQTVAMSDPASILTLTNGQLKIGSGGVLGVGTIYLGGGMVSSSASWSTTNSATLTNLNGNVTFAPASGQTITWSGVLSGSTGGLNVAGPGTLTLSGANTYSGNTTISNGTLALSGGGLITNSASIVVASNAIFNVSGLTSAFTLAQSLSSQTLSNSAPGAIINGTNNCSAGTISLVYDGVNPSFTITNGGMMISSSTAIKVNNTGATLTPGTYKIIAKATGGLVAGTVPSSVTVVGGPIAGTPTLSIVGGELYLTVGGTSTFGYTGGPFTYNGSGQSPTISFSGSTAARTTNYVGLSVSYGPSANTPTNAGTYYVTNTVAADANNFGTVSSQSFTIIAKAASVTADAKSKTYGDVNPVLMATVLGTVNGDALNYTLASDALQFSSVGVSNITVTLLSNPNYSVLTTNSTLTINGRSLAITASAQSKSYGTALTLGTTAFTSSGLTNGDSISGITLTASSSPAGNTATATVGNYTITPSAAMGSGLGNYSITYNTGTLTVSQLAVVLSGTRAYDGTTNAAAADLSVNNAVNGDLVAVTNGPGGLASANVGTNAITSFGSLALGGGAGTNYTLTGASGSMVVTNAPLTITANNDSKAYDGNGYNTNNGVTYTGFVNSETSAVLGGTLTYGGTSQGATNAGTYTIVPSGQTSTNYAISYVNGTLTVTPLTIAVTADAKAKVYGTVNPALTYTFTPALVSGDSFSGALSRMTGESVGSYAINQNTLTLSANYTLNYTGANLTISPAVLGITANNASKSYGQTVTFVGTEFTPSGLQFSDSVTSVTLTSAGATNTASVGTYSIVPSAASGTGLGNYTISYTNGTLTVNPASTFVGASSTMNQSGYKDAVAFLATLPADATGIVVFSSTNGAFSTNTASGVTTTSLSITNLPRGTNVITIAYLGDGNYVGSTNTLNQIVTNHPPVANNASYARNAALNTFKIAVTNLLSNASDADADSLAVASVGATTNNATAIVAGGYVLYYNTNAVADQFTYTVSDGFGGTNTATVTINADSTPLFGQSQIVSTGGGTATLNFAGIPGYSYSVVRSTNLVDWATIWTTNAPVGGLFQFIDLSAPLPSAYYRLQYNP